MMEHGRALFRITTCLIAATMFLMVLFSGKRKENNCYDELSKTEIKSAEIVKIGSHSSHIEMYDLYHGTPDFVEKMSILKHQEERISIDLSDGDIILTIFTSDNNKYIYVVYYDYENNCYYMEDCQDNQLYTNAKELYLTLNKRFQTDV